VKTPGGPKTKGNENVWHLTLYKYSYGQLIKYNTGWQWCPNAKNMFTDRFMLDFFVKAVGVGYDE